MESVTDMFEKPIKAMKTDPGRGGAPVPSFILSNCSSNFPGVHLHMFNRKNGFIYSNFTLNPIESQNGFSHTISFDSTMVFEVDRSHIYLSSCRVNKTKA